MSEVQCFWVEEVGEGHVELRRYVSGPEVCSALTNGYHEASVDIGETWPVVRTAEGYIEATPDDAVPHTDPRWPTECVACHFAFRDTDQWQVNVREGWRRADTGEVVSWGLHGIPAGAMWDALWMSEHYQGPDGLHLTVQLPDGLPWTVDGPASGQNGNQGMPHAWSRTGDPKVYPPTVTATPSILTPQYHGFLTAGKLVSV